MSHHLEIDFGTGSGPELRLVCTATPGSPCRMRPATRAHRTTPPPEPPAAAILDAAAVRGAHHLTQRLEQLIRKLRPRGTP